MTSNEAQEYCLFFFWTLRNESLSISINLPNPKQVYKFNKVLQNRFELFQRINDTSISFLLSSISGMFFAHCKRKKATNKISSAIINILRAWHVHPFSRFYYKERYSNLIIHYQEFGIKNAVKLGI